MESLVDAAVLAEVDVVDAVLEVLVAAEVAEVEGVPDVLLMPSADSAASSAVNSGFPLVELVEEESEEEVVASHPESLAARRVAPTDSRLVLVCEPLTL